jgi:hypothetical protein
MVGIVHLYQPSRLVHPLMQPVIIGVVQQKKDRYADGHVPQGVLKRIGINPGVSLLPNPDQTDGHCAKYEGAVDGKLQLPFDLIPCRYFSRQDAILVLLLEKDEKYAIVKARHKEVANQQNCQNPSVEDQQSAEIGQINVVNVFHVVADKNNTILL